MKSEVVPITFVEDDQAVWIKEGTVSVVEAIPDNYYPSHQPQGQQPAATSQHQETALRHQDQQPATTSQHQETAFQHQDQQPATTFQHQATTFQHPDQHQATTFRHQPTTVYQHCQYILTVIGRDQQYYYYYVNPPVTMTCLYWCSTLKSCTGLKLIYLQIVYRP